MCTYTSFGLTHNSAFFSQLSWSQRDMNLKEYNAHMSLPRGKTSKLLLLGNLYYHLPPHSTLMVKWGNDGLLLNNASNMLIHDGEMLVNEGEKVVIDGEMNWVYDRTISPSLTRI